MANNSVLARVPATVGNFGGAMNCAALALDATLNVKVTPRVDGHVGIRYFGENGERVPRDRSNLIVRAMEAAFHLRGLEFTGGDLEIYSSVPVAVGLGSSTAAVLAGLIAADGLFQLELDEKTLFELAAIYESRSDNLRAAWAGGFVSAVENQTACHYRRTVVAENFTLSVVIPDTSLDRQLTGRRARSGERIADTDFRAHLQQAAVLADFFARAKNGHALRPETALPPICGKAVAGLEEALQVRTPDLLSVFVCGSGPAVGVLAQRDAAGAVRAVQECFARRGVAARATQFRPINSGAREWNAVRPEISLPVAKPLASPLAKSTLIPV